MEIVNAIIAFLKSSELKKYGEESLENFVSVLTGDFYIAPLKQFATTGKLLFSIPDILFWDKMHRFLLGTYSDFSYQQKIFERFSTDDEYRDFTKRQLHFINEIDDDKKIDFFAQLTQALALDMIDLPLYFKLASILNATIREELEYLSANIKYKNFPSNVFVIALMQHGLIMKTNATWGNIGKTAGEGDVFDFTLLAHCLDKFSIDFQNAEKYSYADERVELAKLSTDGLHSMHVTFI